MKAAWKFAILLGVVAVCSANAQNWPLPASTPNTPTVCSASCPPALVGKPTPGWSDPFVGFVGRFLDSAYTQDFQQTFRTARAGFMKTSPDGKRIYFLLGNAVAAYDASTFFSRLESHEQLANSTSAPVTPPNVGTHPGSPYETYLQFDQFFYAENGSGWFCPTGDGQDRLFDYDVDDRGVVYMAYSKFSWGTAKDPGTSGAGLMQPNYQEPSGFDLSPKSIFWVKTTSGSYFVLVGNGGVGQSTIYNVDDFMHPIMRGTQDGVYAYSRGGRGQTAIVNVARQLLIFDNDVLITHGQPAVNYAPSNGGYNAVTFDGTSFWAAGGLATGGGLLSRFTPDASGRSYTRTDFSISNSAISVRYRDGFLGMAVATPTGAPDQRLYNISGGTPVEIPLNGVLYHYYSNPPDGFIKAPRSSAGYVEPWMRNGKLYLIIPAMGLGDVWQVRNADSLTVALQGTAGGVNQNTPPRNAGDIFYGDKVGFLATSGSNTAKSVQWNFGSPKPANDPGNSVQGTSGTVAYHQYMGLLPSDIVSPITATATDSATGTSGSVQLTLKTPTVRFGAGNTLTKYLFAQPSASAPAPIVADDSFYDASDGDVSGHFDEWRIDGGAPVYTSPSGGVPAGGCGTHTLTLTAHYGAYTAMVPSTPDFAVQPSGLTPFSYTVQPFASAITYAADDAHDQIIFSSASRVAAALVSSPVTYKWDLVDQSGAVVLSQASTSDAPSISAIASWAVPRSTFTSAGMRARLVITMAAVSTVCTGAATSQTAYSATLPSLPDAVLSVSNCTATGCTYSVSSPSGVMSRDNWTFVWTPSGAAVPSTSTASTYTPAFTTKGTYTVTVKVTNSVGSKTLTSSPITTTANASTCDPLVANSNVYLDGSGSNCRTSSNTCTANDTITFGLTFWNYNPSCGTHTYSWTVDGANAGTAQTITRSLSAGSHTVSCTINNGQSVTLQQSFTIQSSAPPPPPPPPPSSCGTLVANSNVFASYTGASSGCSDRGTTQCSPGESIAFQVYYWSYTPTCATTYTWQFDDGTNLSGQQVSKALSAGTHSVTVTVNNTASSAPITFSVNVGGTPPPPPPPVGNQCGQLSANVNVFLSYSGSAGCKDGGTCSAGDPISFTVSYWQFSPAPGCTATYSWSFDDGGTATGQTVSHTFNTTAQHTATCTITYGTQTLALQTAVNVSNNPATPPPVVTVGTEYIGGGTYRFTPFVTSGTVTKFLWDFGDGSTISTTDAKPVTNNYLKAGKYTVTLTALSNGSSAVVTIAVTVGTSRPRAVRH